MLGENKDSHWIGSLTYVRCDGLDRIFDRISKVGRHEEFGVLTASKIQNIGLPTRVAPAKLSFGNDLWFHAGPLRTERRCPMSENLISKLTSYKWLREAASPRWRNLVNSINFAPYTISREVAGERYSFHIGNPAGKTWYSSQIDQSIEMQFVRQELIRDGMVAIECGAHHGAQSILLSRWVGHGGRVIVVEPMPDNVEILKKNIKLNRLNNVTVIEKAAGPSNGSVFMKKRSNAAVAFSGMGNTIEVASISLDEISTAFAVSPSFLKIDVEGFEYKILEGAGKILSTHPAIFLEVHTLTLPRYGNVFEDLWNFIDPDAYDVFLQENELGQPVPYSPMKTPRERIHLFFRPR